MIRLTRAAFVPRPNRKKRAHVRGVARIGALVATAPVCLDLHREVFQLLKKEEN